MTKKFGVFFGSFEKILVDFYEKNLVTLLETLTKDNVPKCQ